MLEYFTLILFCQLLGEVTVNALGLLLPGPVLGMLFMFGFLLIKGTVPVPLGQLANALLSHLSLLFVPAGVGVMVHVELLKADLLPLTVAMVVSTLLAMVVTGVMMKVLSRRREPESVQQGKR